jgi:hypothetical protein
MVLKLLGGDAAATRRKSRKKREVASVDAVESLAGEAEAEER